MRWDSTLKPSDLAAKACDLAAHRNTGPTRLEERRRTFSTPCRRSRFRRLLLGRCRPRPARRPRCAPVAEVRAVTVPGQWQDGHQPVIYCWVSMYQRAFVFDG